MSSLKFVELSSVTLASGKRLSPLSVSYQTFGCEDASAPLVVVIHALTGNSQVIGERGWWNSLIGDGAAIDTKHYRVLAFNVPGNGYDGVTFANYQDFRASDVASIFWQALDVLGEKELFALIGGSLGGGLAWEMAVQRPNAIAHLIPVAAHWQANDWVLAQAFTQEQILLHADNPIETARIHAMTLYRSPQSLTAKFDRTQREDGVFNIESWLTHHGTKLSERFTLDAYRLMNQLLKTLDAGGKDCDANLGAIKAEIHLIAVDSDGLFLATETCATAEKLSNLGCRTDYHEIHSLHGHDGFLIEFDALNAVIAPIFRRAHQQLAS